MNRLYKDSVFTYLFSDKKNLISLYNALENKNYPLNTKIEINTLKGVLFKKRQNDLSFTIENRYIVLIEHQSTINDNMPLRLLIYISRLYERLTSGKAMYKERMIPLPTPEFIVLYNGVKKFPQEKVYRLSDAFIGKKKFPQLELIVRVVNVNYGENKEIMSRCEVLDEYSFFIDKVRKFIACGNSIECALKNAIDYCISHNKLKNFLMKHSSEVRNMLYQEFNMEDAIEVAKEESFERGVEQGIEQGMERGMEQGRQEIIRNMHLAGLSEDVIKSVLEAK